MELYGKEDTCCKNYCKKIEKNRGTTAQFFPGDPGSAVRLPYEDSHFSMCFCHDLQEAVQHIEADLLLAVYAAEGFELQAQSLRRLVSISVPEMNGSVPCGGCL